MGDLVEDGEALGDVRDGRREARTRWTGSWGSGRPPWAGGSSRRNEYWGRMVQKCPGLRADGTPYAAIIRRRCRCLDCGQVRIDKECGWQ